MPKLSMDGGYTIIWASDLERYFNEVTGLNWSYAMAMDCPSQNTMEKADVPDYDLWAEETNEGEYWDQWFQGGNFGDEPFDMQPSIFCVLHWLVEMSHIPAGKYIVEVWW